MIPCKRERGSRPTLEDADRYLDSFKPSARSKQLWQEHKEFVKWYREREQNMAEHDKRLLNDCRKNITHEV